MYNITDQEVVNLMFMAAEQGFGFGVEEWKMSRLKRVGG